MRYLSVVNWAKFQHYKDRNPPWIKLYHDLLDDYEYGCLKDDSKLLFITMLLLAILTNNEIPDDAEWVARRGNLHQTPDFQPLIDAGFLEYAADECVRPLKRSEKIEFFQTSDRHCMVCGVEVRFGGKFKPYPSGPGVGHIDHIIPRSRGGTNDESNLQILCLHCNCSKQDKLPEEWEGPPVPSSKRRVEGTWQ